MLVMYPAEVLSFSLRANGMGIYTFVSNSAAYVQLSRNIQRALSLGLALVCLLC